MTRMTGVVIGVVQSNDDPQRIGRVRVSFPWLSDDNKSFWAPVAAPMAGSGRGHWFMPEVGDIAVVAFEHGDSQHPYVIGFVWNGAAKPPEDKNDLKVRRLRTVSGHVLEFDDRPGNERVRLETQGHHRLEMFDTDGKVEIESKSGHKIVVSDSLGQILVETKGGQRVQIDDRVPAVTVATQKQALVEIKDAGITISAPTGGVTVNAPMGNVAVQALQATVTASSNVTFTTPTATFSGTVMAVAIQATVIQTTSLMATSVVSATYTPGLGNLI